MRTGPDRPVWPKHASLTGPANIANRLGCQPLKTGHPKTRPSVVESEFHQKISKKETNGLLWSAVFSGADKGFGYLFSQYMRGEGWSRRERKKLCGGGEQQWSSEIHCLFQFFFGVCDFACWVVACGVWHASLTFLSFGPAKFFSHFVMWVWLGEFLTFFFIFSTENYDNNYTW